MKKVKLRKLFASLAMSMTLVFTSCEKKENITPVDISSIVGVWTLDSYIMSITVDGVSYVDYLIDFYITEYGITQEEAEAIVLTYLNEGNDFKVTPEGSIEFKEDGTFEFKEDGTLIIEVTDETETSKETGTWTLDGDVLSVIIENEPIIDWNVTTLNDSNLVIEANYSINDDFNYDGSNEVMVSSFIIKLTR